MSSLKDKVSDFGLFKIINNIIPKGVSLPYISTESTKSRSEKNCKQYVILDNWSGLSKRKGRNVFSNQAPPFMVSSKIGINFTKKKIFRFFYSKLIRPEKRKIYFGKNTTTNYM